MARVRPVDSTGLESSLAEDEFRCGWLRDLVFEGCTPRQIAAFELRHGADWWRPGSRAARN